MDSRGGGSEEAEAGAGELMATYMMFDSEELRRI